METTPIFAIIWGLGAVASFCVLLKIEARDYGVISVADIVVLLACSVVGGPVMLCYQLLENLNWNKIVWRKKEQ